MHDQDDLIEKKLDGTLSAAEMRRFEELLRTDPAFAQAYATQRGMIAALRERYKENLHQQLEIGYQTYQENRRQRQGYYGLAAVLLVAVLGGWFWLSIDQPLFDRYYQPYEAVVYRGASSSTANQAVIHYHQEQYVEAIPLLQSLQQTGDNTEYWTLLLGNVYLQLDSITQAIEQFAQVATSSHHSYSQYGSWYLAMGHLRDKNMTAARETLQHIARQPGLFQHKAQQLLQEL